MKQQILFELNNKLNSMGITPQQGSVTDITIISEFLDAGWSTGSKKISYEASVFANEQDKIVYMYEKTTEVGHGLSFGGSSGTSFQSGTTLFRKVKSVQYGPDGKAYEYTLDLGAIPKAVKETAKLHGWGFKTVINKNKAMYPSGYVPTPIQIDPQVQVNGQATYKAGSFCSNCGMSLTEGAEFCNKCGKQNGNVLGQITAASYKSATQAQSSTGFAQQPAYDNPQGTFYADAPKKAEGKGQTLGLIAFILLGIVLAAMLLLTEATLFGWIFTLVLFSAGFFLQRKMKKWGCLFQLFLWFVTAFILFIGLTIFQTVS